MLRRNTGSNTDPHTQQRIEDCDRYHMHFDAAARTFHDHTAEALASGGVVAFDETFRQLEDATRRRLLGDMYANLDPHGKLALMARLLGDVAAKEFLTGLAEAQSEYDKAMLRIRAEAQASSVLRPALVPKDAELRVYLATQDRVDDLEEDMDLTDLSYDRALTLRAIGDGVFKVMGEDFGEDMTYSEEEYFDTNALVRIGAAYCGKGGARKREEVVRLEEMLAVSCDDQTTFLAVQPEYDNADDEDIVVTGLSINGEQVLPPPAISSTT